MKNLITGKIVLLLLSACVQEIENIKPDYAEDIRFDDHPKNQVYTNALVTYQNNTSSPGSILLIDKPQETLWIGAVGKSNLEYQVNLRTNNLVRTGSVTKMFTAVVIMKLVEEGKLSLETTLASVLPTMNDHIPSANEITIRHLLAHLSGITDPLNESLQYQADLINNPSRVYNKTIDNLLEKYVYGKDLHFKPGTAYSYSNSNYWILGKIAETITGNTIQQEMKEKIFLPLEMNDTWLEKRDDKNVSRGYVDLYSNGVLQDVTTWDRAEGGDRAASGLISTADDLRKFMRGLFSGELVSLSTVEQMKTIQLPDCNSLDCEYGLGLEIWRTDAGTAYGHNGSLVGLEINVLWYEDNEAISVLYKNNGNFSDKSWLSQLIK